jgi:small subunit ribosomal protein S1
MTNEEQTGIPADTAAETETTQSSQSTPTDAPNSIAQTPPTAQAPEANQSGLAPEAQGTTTPSPVKPPEVPPEVPAAAADLAKPSVSIGSQRDPANKSLKPSAPKAVQAAVANPINLSGEEIEQVEVKLADIKSDAGLSDDIDAEIEAALGDISMDDVVSVAQASTQEIEAGTRMKVIVSKIHADNVFVKLGAQAEGVAAFHQFKEEPAEGDEVELIVRSRNSEDGLYELAVPGAAIGASDWDEITEGDVLEATVTGSNTGGLEASVGSLNGFIPASQIDRFRVEDFSQYVGKKLTCVAVEVKPDKRRLVLSRRSILDRENEEKRKELLAELEAGQIREGVVTKLMDFGAFVDLGGMEGLIHISKISWSRVKHPSEVVKEGEGVRVKVESIDTESNRISLSLRDLTDHPWEKVNDGFQVDEIVKGTVTRIADFGAFVQLMPGVEGLVHISELAYKRVAKVSNVVSEGQELEVKILSIDKESQKISLSHKACLSPPPKRVDGKPVAKEEDLPARDLVVPTREEPLKGGNDRKAGGESIGLKW